MAVLAVAHVGHIGNPSATQFDADVSFIGFSNPPIDAGITVTLAVGLTQAQMETDVKNAVRDELVNNHGFTFTPVVDTVELI